MCGETVREKMARGGIAVEIDIIPENGMTTAAEQKSSAVRMIEGVGGSRTLLLTLGILLFLLAVSLIWLYVSIRQEKKLRRRLEDERRKTDEHWEEDMESFELIDLDEAEDMQEEVEQKEPEEVQTAERQKPSKDVQPEEVRVEEMQPPKGVQIAEIQPEEVRAKEMQAEEAQAKRVSPDRGTAAAGEGEGKPQGGDAPELRGQECTLTDEMQTKEMQSSGRGAAREGDEVEPPVIRVNDVTMTFQVMTESVSGIKEYMIRRASRQMKRRELHALNHVSFEVARGEVVGIIGTNGSGKSTLLKIVAGALKPTSGSVEVDRRKIQILTLGTGFDGELTAHENVYLNGSIIGYTKEFIDSQYDWIVSFAELEGFMEEKVKNFSSGMVSRLGFAIATAGNAAEILILDEVLSVGDEFFRKKSMARIKEMIHGGSTVLIVSHSTGTITEHCTKAVWIEKGELKMVGEPKAVCGEYRRMAG